MIVRIIFVFVVMGLITALTKAVLSKAKVKSHRIQTIITLLHSTVQYVTAIVGLIWVLSVIGVDVNTIFASVGIVALIVGFSAESLIADVITGLFMIFENQFNVGDVVEIDGYRGSVEQIGIRTISIRDSGDNLKIINNSNIKNMINLSSNISKAVCDIGISYEADLKKSRGCDTKSSRKHLPKTCEYFSGKPAIRRCTEPWRLCHLPESGWQSR